MAHEFMILFPIEPIRVKQWFGPHKPLPLHCTVMPWFSLGRSIMFTGLYDEFEAIAAQFVPGSLELVSDHSDLFGPNNDVPVQVLERNPALMELHHQLLRWLAGSGSLPTDPTWTGTQYRPHVTCKGSMDFPPGSRHAPSGLVLVSRPPDRIKRVISAPASALHAA